METREFFSLLFKGEQGYICAWFNHLKYEKKQDRTYDLSQPGAIDRLIESAAKASAKGWDCYFAPAVFSKPRRLKENVTHSNVLWADFDKLPDSGLPEFELHPTAVVQSSAGKFHVYWALASSVGTEKLEELNRGLAYAFKADKSGWDANQLLRIPDTFNYKYDTPQSVAILTNGVAPRAYKLEEFVGFLVGSLTATESIRHPGRPLASLRVWI